jgi:hypothetical protein
MKLNNPSVAITATTLKDKTGWEMSKAEVKGVFLGKKRVAHCICRECGEPHEATFPVWRKNDGIEIGCHTFGTKDVAKVQKWLKSKAKEMKNETNR